MDNFHLWFGWATTALPALLVFFPLTEDDRRVPPTLWGKLTHYWMRFGMFVLPLSGILVVTAFPNKYPVFVEGIVGTFQKITIAILYTIFFCNEFLAAPLRRLFRIAVRTFPVLLVVTRLVTRVSAVAFRVGLSGLHAGSAGVRSATQSMAVFAFKKASKPAWIALIAYAIALWFSNYKVSIFHEIEVVIRAIPVVVKQAVFRWTLDGISPVLFLPNSFAPIIEKEPASWAWLLVDGSRLLALVSILLALAGAALLAVSIAAAITGWICEVGSGLVAGALTTRREDARFARWWDVIRVWKSDGAGFGYYGRFLLRLRTGKHILVMASTRSGKGTSFIVPHLLRYRGSAFILDPKGENASITGRRRGELNGAVHYLDPFGISGKPRSRFNPLSRFTAENMEAESKALAAALVLAERDHWTASAQQLLAAFILYVVTSPEIPAEGKDLNAVRRALLGNALETLKIMKGSEAADGLLAELARSFLVTPERELGSIISTAQRETEILDNPFIAACLSASGPGDEVDFADWHRGTMTVFLCLAAPKFPVFNRWLRLVLTSALDEMTDSLKPPALPVCFMLDELATLGHLPVVENAVGLAAGYGVQLVTVFQDIGQMRDLYKGRWTSFIGNAGIRLVFNLDDYDTAEYWSRSVGGRRVRTVSRSTDNFGISRGQTSSESVEPLLTPDQFTMRYSRGAMLVLSQGSYPIEVQRVAYFDDTSLAGLWDDPGVSVEAWQAGVVLPGASSQAPWPDGATGATPGA